MHQKYRAKNILYTTRSVRRLHPRSISHSTLTEPATRVDEYTEPHPKYAYFPGLDGSEKLDVVMNFLLSRADVAPGTGEAEQLAVMHQIFARDYLIHIDTILSVIAYRHYCDNSKIGQSGYLFDHLDEFYEKTMAANIL